MNIVSNPALVDILAASHAVGTLRGGARRRFEALARAHPSVRVAALTWQERLSSLTEIQPAQTPHPAVWKRIEGLLAAERQAQAMAAAAAAKGPAAARPGAGWWSSPAPWRWVGALATVAAVAVGVRGMMDAQGFAREAAALQGQIAQLRQQLAVAPQVRYVAVLVDEQSLATMLVTVDAANRRLVLKRVAAFQEAPDKSLQLWALPPDGRPRSLGVLGRDEVVRLNASDDQVRQVPALAISLEPLGGVPSEGGPTGPVLFKGALIQTAL